MHLAQEILKISQTIDKLHINDPAISRWWDQLAALLSQDEAETIAYLQQIDDDGVILDLSAVIDDVAWQFQSREYIQCLDALQARKPHLHLAAAIASAKNMME